MAEVTRLGLPAAAVLATVVFGLTATLAIWLAVRQVLGQRVADATALLFVFFPSRASCRSPTPKASS